MPAKTGKRKFRPNTRAQEARIKSGIEADSDTRELTARDFPRMRPFSEIIKRGRPKSTVHKIPVTVRLDEQVIAYFRGSGRGWQTRMNAALAAYVAQARRASEKSRRAP
jgi:uncharacterized protein (DUF4415 family)